MTKHLKMNLLEQADVRVFIQASNWAKRGKTT